MTVYVLMIIQTKPFRSETIHSIYYSQDTAEEAAAQLEYGIQPGCELDIEAFEVYEEEYE
jgi:hypothetical protein